MKNTKIKNNNKNIKKTPKYNIFSKYDDYQALIILSVSLMVVILDQLLKFFVMKNMQVGESFSLLSRILHITYVQNTGAGFGLLQENTRLLIWFSIIVIGLIFYFYEAIPKSRCIRSAVAAILGGTLGNLIDRIRLGYVIDFIDFGFWPSFNIADIAITLGTITLIIYLVKNK